MARRLTTTHLTKNIFTNIMVLVPIAAVHFIKPLIFWNVCGTMLWVCFVRHLVVACSVLYLNTHRNNTFHRGWIGNEFCWVDQDHFQVLHNLTDTNFFTLYFMLLIMKKGLSWKDLHAKFLFFYFRGKVLRSKLKMRLLSLQQNWDLATILAHLCLRFVSSQQCDSTYTCHYEDTEGKSTLFREFLRPQSTDHTCLWYCTEDPKCEAVTHDRTRDICRFHFEADDIPCLQMLSVTGNSLWVITEYEHYNARCYEVIHIAT